MWWNIQSNGNRRGNNSRVCGKRDGDKGEEEKGGAGKRRGIGFIAVNTLEALSAGQWPVSY
jgi:hypothetical protein